MKFYITNRGHETVLPALSPLDLYNVLSHIYNVLLGRKI